MILSDLCAYTTEKVETSKLNKNDYISTENMLPNKMGVEGATSLPSVEYTTAYYKNDVLVSNIRPYFKKIWLADKKGGCSTDVLVFKNKKNVDPIYLYYLLSDDNFFNYAMATSKGTKMPRGDKFSIMNYPVPNFELSEQIKIGSILKSFDDKISLNQKQNNNLEQQAQSLFLDIVKSNHFGNKLLSDIATIKYGKGLPTTKLTKAGYKVFGGNGVIGYFSDYLYKDPQILISCRGAASGTILISHPYSYVTNNSLVMELKDRRYYEFLKQYFLLYQLHSYTTGSAQPQITIDNLKAVEVPYPDYEAISSITNCLISISQKTYSNICENEKLSQLRDTLLPKLMSGEIDVSKVKINEILDVSLTDKLSFTGEK